MAHLEFPQHLLDEVLADPEAMAILREFARRQGNSTPISDMSRNELSQLAGALMAEAGAKKIISGNNVDGEGFAHVDERLTEAVFADPGAQNILKDLALAHGWTDEPSQLPEMTKRIFVTMLIEQGILCVEATPESSGVADDKGTSRD